MRAKVYIDGYNLYYGCLKGHPELKWLDPVALARRLVRSDLEIVGVEYFTSRVKTYPHDQSAVERQKIYLQALSTRADLSVIEGYYNRNKTWAPFVEDVCRNCKQFPGGMAHIMKLEEKRSDVNLATGLLWDAFSGLADVFVLISGDSDFIGPVDLIRHKMGKQVIIFNPHASCRSDLECHATYYSTIPADALKSSQLPDSIPVGTHGNFIHRPAAWR